MNQQIEQYQTQDADVVALKNDRQNAGVEAIHREVEVIEDAAKVVPILIDGGMAPAIYMPDFQPKKGGPQQGRNAALSKAMAAAVYGATLGFGAAKSLQNVFTVHGQPSIYARTAVALVMSHGHDVWTVEAGPNSVTVAGRRKGRDHVETSTWDLDRAVKAGFTSNQKYKSQPEEMLWAKAARTVCRRAFPDVMEGIPYSTEELELEPDHVAFTAVTKEEKVRIRVGIPGRFMIYNTLDVLGAALALGISLESSARTLAKVPHVKGRVEVVPTPGKDYTILIDYAHSPDGLENVLSSVKDFAKGRTVALFGCGGDRDKTKRPKMGRIAAKIADFVVVTTDNPRTEKPADIIADILPGMADSATPYVVVEDRVEAIHWAMDHAEKDDVIVLCGKGHETYQEVNHVKHHMDEREIVAEHLEAAK